MTPLHQAIANYKALWKDWLDEIDDGSWDRVAVISNIREVHDMLFSENPRLIGTTSLWKALRHLWMGYRSGAARLSLRCARRGDGIRWWVAEWGE